MSEGPGGYAGEDLRAILDDLSQEILSFLDLRRDTRVLEEIPPEEMRRRLASGFDFEAPLPLGSVRESVSHMLRRWTLHVTHPAYFGLFNPPVDPAGIIADTLVALYNPQLAAWSHAPAANEIERHTLDFFAKSIWPDTESGTGSFTSGGAEANLSALIAALTHSFPSFGEGGARTLPGAPRFYASEESHHSLLKAAHFTGLGREALRLVKVGSGLGLDVDALQAAIDEDRAEGHLPFLVIGTAGTTSAGVIDPLPELAALCVRENLWFHVDAAWGGTACVAPRLRSHLSGIEQADSVTWDAHKWLSVPMGAGMFFCRKSGARAAAFRARTPYMPGETAGAIDPYVSTMQWSRRFTGLKLFMSLAVLGREGLARRVESQAEMGNLLRRRLLANGWEIVNSSPLPVICFRRPGVDDPAACAALLQRLYRRGRVWISAVSLPHVGSALRACITSYETDPSDVDLLVTELAKAADDRDLGDSEPAILRGDADA